LPETQNNSHINLSIFNTMRAAMGDIFNEILAAFFNQSRMYMDELKVAYEEKNYPVLERIFHSLGSSSLNMGAEQLSGLARDLEKKTIKDVCLITFDDIDALQVEYFLVEKVLNDLMSDEKSL